MPRKSQSFPPTPLHLDFSAVRMILYGHQNSCWPDATISRLCLPVRVDGRAVVGLLQLLELLLPAESPACPADPTPLQVPLPVLPSGLHNIKDRKTRERTEDLKSIRAVRVMNSGFHYPSHMVLLKTNDAT